MSRSPLEKLATAQHRSPWIFILCALALSVAMFPLVRKLKLNSDFTALLPQSAPSVRDLDEIEKRVSGLATLSIAVSADDIAKVRAFTRALAPRIEKLGLADHVVAVDWNIQSFKDFVQAHRFLYADLADIQKAREALETRMVWEKKHANPVYVDLEDRPPPDTKAIIDDLAAKGKAKENAIDKYPEGFFQHPKLPLVLIFVRTSIVGGEIQPTDKLVADIKAEIAAVGGEKMLGEGGRIDIGGDVMDSYEEQGALISAALLSLLITVVLVVLAILLFYYRFRAVFLLFLGMVPPLMLTFGLSALLVRYLNASTAFLSSIVIGNGINPCMVWLARYFEARRNGLEVRDAVADAHLGTWRGTLTASLAAATSYGSLMFTTFRGFRDFGVIGGIGMTLCWFSTILVLPALCVVTERFRPLKLKKESRSFFGVIFARAALRSPYAVSAISGLLLIAGTFAIGHAIIHDPLENNFHNLASRRKASDMVHWVNERQGEIVDETTTGNGIAILAPTRADVAGLRAYFDKARQRFPHTYGAIRSLDDLEPADQDAKIPEIIKLRAVLQKMRTYADDSELADIDKWMPPDDVKPVGDADIPPTVARPFIEKDGTRGRMLYMEHERNNKNSVYDGRYLIRWTQAARSARVNGVRPAVAGRPPVFADLQGAIFVDGPKAVAIALATTVLLIVLTFGRNRDRVLTLGSLMLGVICMTGACAALGMKLNFLNFVAFPVTFGIGADYGVNVMRRFVEEEEKKRPILDAIRESVEETGGAVVLCSMTTIVGYLSLFTSPNKALNSFGVAMVISEICCLLAAVLALPAVMMLIFRKRLGR